MILIVFPIITMAFLKPAFRAALVQGGYPHANGAEQVVPGQAVVRAFFIVSLTTFAFFSEFGWMTWDRLRASPATSLEIVLGKAIPRVAMVIVQLFVVLGAGVLAVRPAHHGQRARARPAGVHVLDRARAARRRGHRGLPHRATGELVRGTSA